jgi:ParB-like chromosome segregation protein Spo0J
VRKQYHSRHSERGNLIWDVDRLIRVSKQLPRLKVLLSTLRELDEPYWFDGIEDIPTCRAVADHARLIEATDLDHPIILSSSGRIMDGMHRVAKAYLLGHKTVDAVQFDVDPEPDYIDVPIGDLSYEETEET